MARVLVVDDHDDIRELVAAMLTAASHDVLWALDGLGERGARVERRFAV